MKKIVFAVAVILTTAALPSYTKQANVKPIAINSVDPSLALVKKDIGTAD
ncbi:hypothetical protein [Mucilaginibacter phyllosphaerae]|uniref:ABC transporter substrate-binding protein n=1 Tax=Mucilaginibacter phyllosphaerae TaxID=1812349 RepID=A0ABR6I513_9SPHI|nr:hypothetical protein [Mucilaginibacter phyllosphaerae]MBB3967955.1 hypothetical protein [Mucilaginibacter phyllosphaerae]GGH02204.1 hypothetical protein GCM10007352_04300 [Mucilaginibacter phyllosphaerae]